MGKDYWAPSLALCQCENRHLGVELVLHCCDMCHLKAEKVQSQEDRQWWEDTKSLSCCPTEKPLFTTVKMAFNGVEVPKKGAKEHLAWSLLLSLLKTRILRPHPRPTEGWHPGVYIANKLPGDSVIP